MSRNQSDVMAKVQAAVTHKHKKYRLTPTQAAEYYGVPRTSIYPRQWWKAWKAEQEALEAKRAQKKGGE